jgi:hypothetical protein
MEWTHHTFGLIEACQPFREVEGSLDHGGIRWFDSGVTGHTAVKV